MVLRLALMALLLKCASEKASAQQRVVSSDQASVADTTAMSQQFCRAEVMGPDGVMHHIYIRANPLGYSRLLPFYYTKEEAAQFGKEALSINVDKVKWLKAPRLYQEHMVVKGKRQHVLATRLVNGPVELFNYTEVANLIIPVPLTAVGVAVGAAVIASNSAMGGLVERTWYLRRDGETVKVSRGEFIAQLTSYFADDATTAAAITNKAVVYQDMVQIVQGYNQRRSATATPTDTK
jgi:hypothetical protein